MGRSARGTEARFQAAAYAVLARGIAAFLFAFLDLGAVGVVVVVGLVRRRRRRGWCWRSGAPDQFRVELTASACGAAVHELGGGAEPRAYGLADGLGLGEGLVACAWPARIRLPPHGAARPRGSPGWRELDVGAAPHLWPRVGGAVSMHSACTHGGYVHRADSGDGACVVSAYLVQLVRVPEPRSLGAFARPPALNRTPLRRGRGRRRRGRQAGWRRRGRCRRGRGRRAQGRRRGQRRRRTGRRYRRR